MLRNDLLFPRPPKYGEVSPIFVAEKRESKYNGFPTHFRRGTSSSSPNTFGDERHIIVDNVKVATISAGAKAPASSSRKVLTQRARSEVLAHIIVGNVKVATISAGALAPALSASVKTRAALPQCCFAAFGNDTQRGITLLEIVFAISLIAFLVSSVAFIYVVSLRGWENLGHRTDLHEKLHFALERVVRDVRNANALSVNNHTLVFTLNENGWTNTYQYYLYSPNDSCPPVFNQNTYELRRMRTVSCNPNGVCVASSSVCGTGELIVTGLKPPNDTTITSSGNVAMIKLTAFEEDDKLTVQGDVHPRNMP